MGLSRLPALSFLSAALLAEFQVQLFEYGFWADFVKKLGHLQGLNLGKLAVAGDMGEKKNNERPYKYCICIFPMNISINFLY